MNQPEPEAALREAMSHRRRLTNVAYRLLGSLADAEDAVQEALIRWYALPAEQREAIESPAAWLTTVTSRCRTGPTGQAVCRARWPTRPTGSPSTSRSTWRSSWCSTR